MLSKDLLRSRALEHRAARAPDDVLAAGSAIARRVLAICDGLPAGAHVAAYLSTGGEPDTGAVVDALRERDLEVLVPVVLGGGLLDWARYAGPGTTVLNRLGIAEPTGPRLGPEAVATADLLVVPGLAVDRLGHRLGRGGGYYDRALARVGAGVSSAGVSRVILVYDDEVLDAVPYEPHDECVDVAVTPTRTLPLSRG